MEGFVGSGGGDGLEFIGWGEHLCEGSWMVVKGEAFVRYGLVG